MLQRSISIELRSSSSRQSIKSYYVYNSYAKYCATDQKRSKGIEHAPNGTSGRMAHYQIFVSLHAVASVVRMPSGDSNPQAEHVTHGLRVYSFHLPSLCQLAVFLTTLTAPILSVGDGGTRSRLHCRRGDNLHRG